MQLGNMYFYTHTQHISQDGRGIRFQEDRLDRLQDICVCASAEGSSEGNERGQEEEDESRAFAAGGLSCLGSRCVVPVGQEQGLKTEGWVGSAHQSSQSFRSDSRVSHCGTRLQAHFFASGDPQTSWAKSLFWSMLSVFLNKKMSYWFINLIFGAGGVLH